MTRPEPHDGRLAESAQGYWVQSRQPLVSLVFIAPLLVTYETGVLVLGPERVRNGADAWLRWMLQQLQFGQYFLLPVLTAVLLLAWHHITRRPWRISGKLLYAMTAECILLAICLRLLSQLQGVLTRTILGRIEHVDEPAHLALSLSTRIGDAVGFLGAGIYEELLFRLLLLSLACWVFGRLNFGPRWSLLAGVLTSSLLFAAAHYVGAAGYQLNWHSFTFRFLAGVFFATLFVYRGFGVAAGTHAGYDILVGCLWC